MSSKLCNKLPIINPFLPNNNIIDKNPINNSLLNINNMNNININDFDSDLISWESKELDQPNNPFLKLSKRDIISLKFLNY